MTYLLDANVWLEVIVDRAHAADVQTFIRRAVHGTMATTDYAVHSIGLYLYRDAPDAFREFLDDLVRLRINTLHLAPPALFAVLDVANQYHLDFDDAFQYVAAERSDLQIVSLDADFDRTPRGRLTPAQALAQLRNGEKS